MTRSTLFPLAALGAALHLASSPAQAVVVTIDFDDLAAGTILSTQYSPFGATFSPNAFTGPGSSSTNEPWATNTQLTVVSITGSDVGGLGLPNLASGNVLHSYSDWFNADGDPSLRISFALPINRFSATFVGVNWGADVTLWAYNGLNPVSTVSGTGLSGQFALSLSGDAITSVVVRPGSFQDWVGIDSITYNVGVVPEVGTYAQMALGLAALVGLQRFKRRKTA